MGILQENISGQKFGMLTAVCWDHNEKHVTKTGREVYHNYWKFVCDCGKTKILRKGRVKPFCRTSIHSCGCKRNEHKKRGYELISGTYWGTVKKSAKKRGIEFDLKIEDAWKRYVEQKGLCALTNLKIVFSKKNQTASLDRIDSNNGYLIGNVQWVHRDINQMKWDFDMDYFKSLCKLVVENSEE